MSERKRKTTGLFECKNCGRMSGNPNFCSSNCSTADFKKSGLAELTDRELKREADFESYIRRVMFHIIMDGRDTNMSLIIDAAREHKDAWTEY